MRSFPLAIAFLDADDDTVRNVVLHQAALTHQDPAAGWGSLVAVNVMRAALHEFRDPLGAIDATLGSMPTPVATVYEPLLNGSWEPSKPAPSNGSVWGCLAQALWSVRNNLGFEQAVVAAINLGGDTDTVACVAGAISGAIYGLGSIPERWVRNVNGSVDTSSGRAAYRANDITTLAHRLLG
jgi:ADP-ribosyl-[dinitrogen reductase] hydrolase